MGKAPELRDQFPSLDADSGELWDRWSIQERPPDVLVTNYSMLNIMLMRALECPIFDMTCRWLREDRSRVFHLVIDELHSYRGTPGSEVGYLLRLLLRRIGLRPDSSQVRFLASSASLDAKGKGADYLRGFFGADATTFAVIEDETRHQALLQPGALQGKAVAFAGFGSNWKADPSGEVLGLAERLGVACRTDLAPRESLALVLRECGATEAVREGCPAPMTPKALGHSLFGPMEASHQNGMAGLLNALTVAHAAALTIPIRRLYHSGCISSFATSTVSGHVSILIAAGSTEIRRMVHRVHWESYSPVLAFNATAVREYLMWSSVSAAAKSTLGGIAPATMGHSSWSTTSPTWIVFRTPCNFPGVTANMPSSGRSRPMRTSR